QIGAGVDLIDIARVIAVIGAAAVAVAVPILGRHDVEVAGNALSDAKIAAVILAVAAIVEPAVPVEVEVVPAVAIAVVAAVAIIGVVLAVTVGPDIGVGAVVAAASHLLGVADV